MPKKTWKCSHDNCHYFEDVDFDKVVEHEKICIFSEKFDQVTRNKILYNIETEHKP